MNKRTVMLAIAHSVSQIYPDTPVAVSRAKNRDWSAIHCFTNDCGSRVSILKRGTTFMTKRFAALFALTLSWLIIGDLQSKPLYDANAYAISTAASSVGQQPAGAAAVTWEYRILNGNAFHLATLESSINRLTEQGYIIETFHPVSSISGGRTYGVDNPFGINSTTEIFVLLRRIRR